MLQAIRINVNKRRLKLDGTPEVRSSRREGVPGRRSRSRAEYECENEAQWRTSGVDGASSSMVVLELSASTRPGVILRQSASVRTRTRSTVVV